MIEEALERAAHKNVPEEFKEDMMAALQGGRLDPVVRRGRLVYPGRFSRFVDRLRR